MKVLLADTDWRFARQMTSYLESHAHLVVHETAAEPALARCVHWQPELVIVAAELTEQGLLESIQQLAPRPAILLTGWMHRYDRVWRAWQRGGDELLMKPVFAREEMHDAIVATMENATAGTRGRPAATPASA